MRRETRPNDPCPRTLTGRNVLVDPEHVARIVLPLDLREPRELVGAECRAHAIRRLAHADVVDVHAAVRERLRRVRRRSRPERRFARRPPDPPTARRSRGCNRSRDCRTPCFALARGAPRRRTARSESRSAATARARTPTRARRSARRESTRGTPSASEPAAPTGTRRRASSAARCTASGPRRRRSAFRNRESA